MPLGTTVEVFFDGECPLCVREIGMLRRLDRKHQRIAFTDITAPTFEASAYGKTMEGLMGTIQGRDEQGEWITGVEVFRQLYRAVGLGWLVRITRLPGVRWVLDASYRVFARNRLRLTGRSMPASCDTDRCDRTAANGRLTSHGLS
ncbi:MAG: DUF393 domain-containing protein [Deltaproteobacteria bacterium]|nr:DUF393 domain-containing protein [Deltaproteobacteria bacterium]